MKKMKKGYAPPFNTTTRGFKHTIMAHGFPEIEEESLKIKGAPIRLSWKSNEQKALEDTSQGSSVISDTRGGQNGKWFRSPPKVQIVAEILGVHPSEITRVAHPDGGRHIGDGDPESGHLPPDPTEVARAGFTSAESLPTNPSSSPIQIKSLAKFVGHLWRGALAKSFAVAVRAEAAPVVKVVMQPRGGGHRGGFGQGHDGFGSGRQGRGIGCGEDWSKAEYLEALGRWPKHG